MLEGLNPDLLEALPSAGVREAKQSRSRQTQQALLAAGHALLRDHDLASLTVAQVAASAGVAVGSFYARFDDKHAWFSEIAREAAVGALTELAQLLASPPMRSAPLAERVELLMQWLVRVHRDNAGLYRAAISDPAQMPRYWGPLQRVNQQVVDQAAALLLPTQASADGTGDARRRLDFAFQMVFGTLVQAALYDAGPLKLADPALPTALADSLRALIEAAPR